MFCTILYLSIANIYFAKYAFNLNWKKKAQTHQTSTDLQKAKDVLIFCQRSFKQAEFSSFLNTKHTTVSLVKSCSSSKITF